MKGYTNHILEKGRKSHVFKVLYFQLFLFQLLGGFCRGSVADGGDECFKKKEDGVLKAQGSPVYGFDLLPQSGRGKDFVCAGELAAVFGQWNHAGWGVLFWRGLFPAVGDVFHL